MNGIAADEVRVWHREAERALNARDYRRTHELCLRILTASPDSADALFLLGMIAAEHGNFGKALEVIDRALAIDPRPAEYHAHRARCLVPLHRTRDAFEAALRALERDPQDALTLDTVGVVMARTGAHAEALEPFRRAVARDPDNSSYQYNLGASLQFVGDFAGAQAAYRRALAIDPDCHRAWSALAQAAHAPLSAEEAAYLEEKLRSGALEADAQLHVCHALAKQHEDLGRYADAFRCLDRGKRGKRESIAYSFETDRELFAAADSTAGSMTSTAAGCSSAEPIFIVGMPRTGTTLVERILSSHPDVFSAGELTNFALVLKRAAATPSNRVLDAETLAAGGSVYGVSLGEAYVDSTRPRTGHTRCFIDKMPLNFFYAALIHKSLPHAKIVCVRRNPLDTCLSNYRQLFATSFSYYNYSYDLLDTGRYYVLFDALVRRWREVIDAGRFLEIRYEDVVEHTEREARRLVAFCGLPWDAGCLKFQENRAPVATASSVQVRQPIYRTAVGRWRRYEQELEPLRRLLRDAGVV